MTFDQIPVGISACLLGNPVRFDGGHKRLAFAVEQLSPYFQFEAVCPEMAVGLPVPRPALRLVKNAAEEIVLRASNGSPLDVTAQMQRFSAQKVGQLQHLCGYIVCAKSPSCGMERVKVYDASQKNARKSGTGLFTQELLRQLPWLPVEEDGRLHDPGLRENFIERVYALHELHQLWRQGLNRGALMAFHSRYKLLLLAHSQPEYRELGRFMAGIDKWTSLDDFAREYRLRLMKLLSHPATRRNHTNVLMHAQGYFRAYLNAPQRRELAQLIDRYRQGLQPLLAPIALLNHYLAEYPDDYLAGQRYFAPYPEALRLRYGH
ncbi:2-thiouracil desulfurase family protein [Brenneria populi]|uniref:2-thiouracil desulfurase family protein n=1 Tax=Brenneria populi TaxID=1505588 RepID=A0ABU6JNH3_9GAMM|nr:2-thiouracil desulfurase family protein [Brenneria populi Li et al. 2015]